MTFVSVYSQGTLPPIRRSLVLLSMLVLCLALGSCAEDRADETNLSGEPRAPSRIVPTAPVPSYSPPVTISNTAAGRGATMPQAQIFRGAEPPAGPASRLSVPPAGPDAPGDITLNFINTDVREVLKAVFADYLKVSYTVDPTVQGPVTLQTGRPVSREAILPVVEQTLRLYGFVIVEDNSLFRIIPSPERGSPKGFSSMSRGGAFGFATEVVPLRFVSADQMMQVMESLAPSGSVTIADANRNLLLVSGTAQERQALIASIGMFDVDWLSGMSFALFNPRFTDARNLARELGQIMGGKDSALNRSVRLVTIERLNVVMAISQQPRHLEQLRTWVQRLDTPGDSVERRIFVYRVQHGRALDLAKVLNRILDRTSPSAASAPGGDSSLPTPTDSPNSSGRPGADQARYPNDPRSAAAAPQPIPAYDPGLDVGALGEIKITADETNNSLVILAAPRDYSVVESALSKLDIMPMQVLLEAVVVEVTLNNDLRYGVQYFYSQKNNQVGLTNTLTNAIVPTLPGFSYIFSAGNGIRIILDALNSVTRVNVISSPEIMVLNNQTATLQVGDQVPVATQQAVSVIDPQAPLVNSIQYRDTGIILKVTPRVNQGGMVLLDIAQEVSDVARTTSSLINSPTIQQRKIQSSVAVRDNETIALGGLIRSGSTRTRGGVPYLMDIPVVGNLFRTTENLDEKTELLVLITPRVVDSVQRSREVTDELRRKMPAVEMLMRPSPKNAR